MFTQLRSAAHERRHAKPVVPDDRGRVGRLHASDRVLEPALREVTPVVENRSRFAICEHERARRTYAFEQSAPVVREIRLRPLLEPLRDEQIGGDALTAPPTRSLDDDTQPAERHVDVNTPESGRRRCCLRHRESLLAPRIRGDSGAGGSAAV